MKRGAPMVALLLTVALAGCGGGDTKELEVPANPNATQTLTMTDVAKHADDSSCWTVVNGKVYDVTTWIGQHPGGEQRIRGLCGQDATQMFGDQHAGQNTAEERLSSFQIGTLTG